MEKEYIIHLLLFSKIFPSKIEKIYNENIYTNSIDYQIIAAPYISPETAETCKKHMLGYIDYSGNCFIAFANIIIVYTGQKNLYPNTDRRSYIMVSSPTGRVGCNCKQKCTSKNRLSCGFSDTFLPFCANL